MSVIIKTGEMQYRDQLGNYHGINAIAEKKIADQVADLDAAISSAQTAVDGIDAQRQTMIAAIASVAGQGTDTTLTQSGVAADAKSAGDEIRNVKSAIKQDKGDIKAVENGVQTFFAFSEFEHYGLKSNLIEYKTSQTCRVSCLQRMTFSRNITVSVANGFRWVLITFTGDTPSGSTWITDDKEITAGTVFTVSIARVTEDASEIADVAEFLSKLTFKNKNRAEIDSLNTALGTETTNRENADTDMNTKITHLNELVSEVTNVCDYSQTHDGRPVATAGADIDAWNSGGSSYCTTNYFAVEKNVSYTITNLVSGSTYFRLFLYGSDKKFISASDARTSSTGLTWEFKETSNDAAYARCVINVSNRYQKLMICKSSEYIGEYVDNGTWTAIKKLFLANDQQNALKDKNLWNFGDSIGRGAGNNNVGYAEKLASKYEMNLYEYAVSGATICKALKPANNIYDQVVNAISANEATPDYILIEGSTNDISQDDYETYKGEMVPVETTGSYTNQIASDGSTMCNSLEYIIQQLRASYPRAKIAFVIVHKMSSRNISRIYEAHDICAEICEKWCIPVADIFAKGQLNTKLASMKQFTMEESEGVYDSTHPNNEGYDLFYMPIIEDVVKNM